MDRSERRLDWGFMVKRVKRMLAKGNGHLRGNIETHSVKFPKICTYLKSIQMKMPNIEKERAPSDHILSVIEASSSKFGLYLIG